ncbi:GNAT family N-acetyltransferase [Streptomyces sp. SID3343]|uniref:GNAT family N-acetyltransferase n=1 Tax=Streptomyces sp. SID3343 TaxID=2690260 RepID=UPI00136DAC0A|nr:GNAT family N-acetyltransferase [Streptomyces sp. SID3343]MYV97512.1 GNAT family N-acetyltransferase [Streptomyces sp. SID3343]
MTAARVIGRARLTMVGGDADGGEWPSYVRVRVARLQDAAGVREMHERCSAETRRLRYFTSAPRLPESALTRLLEPRDGVSLVAAAPDGTIGAMATLFHPAGGATGEVGLLVEDAWQGRGLGTALLCALVEIAAERGLTDLRAHVLPWNRRMLALFERAGLVGRRSYEDGVVLVQATVPRSDSAAGRCA